MVFLATSEPSLIETPPLGGLKIAFIGTQLIENPGNQPTRPFHHLSPYFMTT
jgi:hypothetical protein